MKPRLNAFQVSPEGMKAMMQLESFVQSCGFDRKLIHLVKARASQINGCAYCLDMHTHEAREDGETEQRLYLLPTWRESPLYSDRECAALAWTEALTLVSDTHAPDGVYESVKAHFSEPELVNLSLLIIAINGWNRLAVGFRSAHPVRVKAHRKHAPHAA